MNRVNSLNCLLHDDNTIHVVYDHYNYHYTVVTSAPLFRISYVIYNDLEDRDNKRRTIPIIVNSSPLPFSSLQSPLVRKRLS